MSLKKHRTATLEGYRGPYFFPELKQLMQVQQTAEIKTLGDADNIAQKIPGFKPIKAWESAVTNDGYGWFFPLNFEREGGEVAILFPWHRDIENRDGTNRDRSVAVYVKGKLTKAKAQGVVVELINAMLNFTKIAVVQQN